MGQQEQACTSSQTRQECHNGRCLVQACSWHSCQEHVDVHADACISYTTVVLLADAPAQGTFPKGAQGNIFLLIELALKLHGQHMHKMLASC